MKYQGGETMEFNEMIELRDYCDDVRLELSTWKNRLDSVVRGFDIIQSNEKFMPYITELHIISDELANRIEHLKTRCEVDWHPH